MEKKEYSKGIKAQIEEENKIRQARRQASTQKNAQEFAEMLDNACKDRNLVDMAKRELIHEYILHLIVLLAVISLATILLLTIVFNLLIN